MREPEVHPFFLGIERAVKGIPEEKRLEVGGKLEDIFGDMDYDVILLEEEKYLRREISKRIEEEAVLWKP
jgi:hypothetical protein